MCYYTDYKDIYKMFPGLNCIYIYIYYKVYDDLDQEIC